MVSFHLVPCKPVFDHWNYHKKVQEKVAWSCEHQKVDISPVLSYSTAVSSDVLYLWLSTCMYVWLESTRDRRIHLSMTLPLIWRAAEGSPLPSSKSWPRTQGYKRKCTTWQAASEATQGYECKPEIKEMYVRNGTELNWKLNFTPMKHRESVIRTHTHRGGGLFNGSI